MFKLTKFLISRHTSRMFSTYETLSVTSPKEFVAHVELNRPDRLNAMNYTLWHEIGKCFDELNASPNVRSIVLTGAGKHFCAGIDLLDMLQTGQKLSEEADVARKAKILDELIEHHQKCISALENCLKPVISATHAAVVGAGVNLVSTADIRYCTKDCWFSVKEVDIGMAADVGALQRLPKIMGSQSLVRELCYTARKFKADEALHWGFVNRVFETKEEMLDEAVKIAELIASKSPVAVQATKKNLVYSLDHTNQEGLDQIREINRLNLQSDDFINAVIAGQSKGEMPVFSKL